MASFSYDEDILDRYPYIIIAYRDGDSIRDTIYTPYVLDVDASGKSNAGSGFTITGPDSDGDFKVTALYDGKLYYYRTDKKSALPSSTSEFEALYDSANSSATKSLEKGQETYVSGEKYAYLVLALKVDGEFLPYTVVDTSNGNTSGGDTPSFDDGSNKSGYGFTVFDDSDGEVILRPDCDGTITLLIVTNGDVQEYANVECKEDVTCRIKLPTFGGLGNLFKNFSTFYLQLTDSNGNKYQAYKVSSVG